MLAINGVRYDPASRRLTDEAGTAVALRPQAVEVLHHLAIRRGRTVSRHDLMQAVWPDVAVTDDSLVQCIADIRRAIGEGAREALQTFPKKGYRLNAEVVGEPVGQARTAERGPAVRLVAAGLVLVLLVAAVLVPPALRRAPEDPRIVVLPFVDPEGDPRLVRLGRGLSVDIAGGLAGTPGLGVIGAESAFRASGMPLAEVVDWLDTAFVLDGSIEAEGEALSISARLTDGARGELLWSERWTRPAADYVTLRDEIGARVGASIMGHFWFGAINLALHERARAKPRYRLDSYEEYLLGIEKIRWTAGDCAEALGHFRRAVELEPGYARAWMMIGSMLQWIGDVSPEPERRALHAQSHEAFRTAYLHAPNDAIVQLTVSIVHLEEGSPAAARRAVLRALDLAPNDADVLALTAWQALSVGLAGEEPLEWARRAIALNPKGPPWHRLGLGIAAFLAEDYPAAIAAMEDAPAHHKKYVFLAAAHLLDGSPARAEVAAGRLRSAYPDYTLSGDYEVPTNPALDRLFEAAEAAGIAR